MNVIDCIYKVSNELLQASINSVEVTMK